MSRRRGEFEHRTSIFEGAFRAWSHLGGLEPEDLESKPASELDPLTTPIEKDGRMSKKKVADNEKRREYPYEPLPRSGLAHPYVQAILSPWLGPDADNEAIQLGLTTLRTWWQHRRKGESGSAIAALGTEKMKGVVEGYTRHFFTLAHCLVMNDKEQPPRTLQTKTKDLEKLRSKRNKKRAREDEDSKLTALALSGYNNEQSALTSAINADLTDSNLSPLERLHAAQRRQLEKNGPIHSSLAGVNTGIAPVINIKNKCFPGKVNLPQVVESINLHANQLAHRGQVPSSKTFPSPITSLSPPVNTTQYGDPSMTPVVFVSDNGDIQIAMTVDGITCAHCVKIVETVLRGCNGNKSPIDGLLDAAADRALCMVLLKIDKSSNAKRIAFEAARNLAMVGYTAKAKEMSVVTAGADKKVTMDLGALSTAFEIVANTDSKDVFNWKIACACPDNGILRDDCARHSQMNRRIFEAFDARERKVSEYMAGCGQKYGMPCTCGPGCRCPNCSEHCKQNLQQQQQQQLQHLQQQQHMSTAMSQDSSCCTPSPMPQQSMVQPQSITQQAASMVQHPQGLDYFNDNSTQNPMQNSIQNSMQNSMQNPAPNPESGFSRRGNNSIISFGNNLRTMSVTSETTFGRAMSGLSALSIDWETLDDFDLNVDHSSHINNNNREQYVSHYANMPNMVQMAGGRPQMAGGRPRRSSLRKSFMNGPPNDSQEGAHVSFKV